MAGLPPPPVPPDMDLRGVPIPRETFAQMPVAQFGVTIKEARAHVNKVADALEGRRSRRRKGRRR